MPFIPHRIYVCYAVFLIFYTINVETYRVRYGRIQSRTNKLRRKKGAILDKLNSYIKTRGYGLFPLKALPEDSIDYPDLDLEEAAPPVITRPAPDEESVLESLKPVKKKKTKNPIIPRTFDQFNPLFIKIAALRTYKGDLDYSKRPGCVDPKSYRHDFIEVDRWDIHPSKLRVRGKYFSKLYEYELKEPMKRHENDTGSPEVVISALTAKIDYLAHHVEHNRKDVQAKRQLTKLGYKRRKLLKYLYRTRKDTYDLLTKTFDIRYEDDFCVLTKIIKKNTHLQHTKSKRYRTARERKEALAKRALGKK